MCFKDLAVQSFSLCLFNIVEQKPLTVMYNVEPDTKHNILLYIIIIIYIYYIVTRS